MIIPDKKYRMFGGTGHEVTFMTAGMEKKPSPGLLEHVVLPPDPTKDIIAFGAKYVESRENLNKAYFANDELAAAYGTIPYKALDIEHEVENIVGHIHSTTYVDRDSNKVISQEDLVKMDAKQLSDLTIDVIVGGIVYADRFPMLEGPVSEKRYAISMECYFDTFDIRLDNGVEVSLEEAELLGWSMLVEALMGSFESKEELDAAHRVKVILADQSEVPMNVYKRLRGIMFSGGGLVLNPACPSCHILSTSRDEGCGCEDKKGEGESSEASMKTQADELLTINLTKLDSYMEEWRKSSEGKKLNHQVKDNIISLHSTEEEAKVEDKEAEKADDTSEPRTGPFSKDTDPNEGDKGPAMCPQYKYEIWIMQGESQERMRHWCVYANEKCPTAGDRTFHECNRWYNRDGDWIYDTRNFRGGDNPFAPEEYDPDEPVIDASTASVEYKQMSAMVDSFLYEVEAKQREKELKSNKKRKK